MSKSQVHWPCIFKLEGDAELLFFAQEAHLYAVLNELIWSDADYLIDSQGWTFLIHQQGDAYQFTPLSLPLSLEGVTQLIREHEFSKAQMCLTKIQFSSIEQAISALSDE